MISIFVHGLPVAQPRAKAVAFGGRARVYNPGTANEWKACVIHAFHGLAGSFKEGVPVRLVMDSLTAAGVWVDDSQVAVSMTVKRYADGPTGCRIMLEEMK